MCEITVNTYLLDRDKIFDFENAPLSEFIKFTLLVFQNPSTIMLYLRGLFLSAANPVGFQNFVFSLLQLRNF